MKLTEQSTQRRPDRRRYLTRWSSLQSVRSTWDAQLRDLNDFISPGITKFNGASDRNQGKKLFGHIINSAPPVAVRTLEAGMMAGITSPARPWFKLTLQDKKLAKRAKVRRWLDEVEETMRQTLLLGNVYNSLPTVYRHLGVTGTALQWMEPDFKDVVRLYVSSPGSYCLATSPRNDIDTIFRRVPMSCEAIYKKWGHDAVSESVREQYARNPDQDHNVLHVVEPRGDRNPELELEPTHRKWASIWMEESPSKEHNKFLEESGFEWQPFQAIRWDISDTDSYGRGPGMMALGDAKALQQYEKRKATLVDKITDPPMKGPSSLRNQAISLTPGAMTYEDTVAGGSRFEPAQIVHPDAVKVCEMSIEQHVRRIDEVFYSHLWLMLARNERTMTATEVAERHEEKMLQLGPVLERLQDELLDPMLDFLFFELMQAGKLPPIPEELMEEEISIEHISILAQAQKMIQTTAVGQVLTVVTNMAPLWPQVKDKINEDKVVEAYADMLGVRADLIRSDDEVEELRADRAARLEQEKKSAQAQQMVEGAKTLSETSMEDGNALTTMLSGMGMAPPGAGQGTLQ